jgi:hypothetical protein
MILRSGLIITTALLTGATAHAQAPTTPTSPTVEPGMLMTPETTPDAPVAPTGSVAVRAIQRTPGGPTIADVEVELLLIHNGAVLDTLTATLDEHGVVLFEDLPVVMGVTPMVRVSYKDVVYQTVGELMDRTNPQQMVEVDCYELTEDAPDWDMHMRHVMVNHGPGGAHVTEILILRNPTKSTWVGKRDSSGKGDTTSFTIPSGAQDVELLNGFHGWCCTSNVSGNIINTLPLMPSGAELSISYVVPAEGGEATLHLEAPVAIGQFMLVVPADMQVLNEDDFTPGGETRIADTDVRFYTISGLAPDQPVHVFLAHVHDGPQSTASTADARPTAASPASGEPTEKRSTFAPALIAGIGGGVFALLLIIVLFMKPARVDPA